MLDNRLFATKEHLIMAGDGKGLLIFSPLDPPLFLGKEGDPSVFLEAEDTRSNGAGTVVD